jgi:uncharacterized protein YegL
MNFNRELLGSVTCVRLTAPEGDGGQQAVNIVVILDVSGSMNDGSKLSNVLLSLEQLLTYLRDDDTLTIIPFSDDVRRPFPVNQEPCTPTGKALIQEKLVRITANGNTHLEAAIRSASEVLAAHSSAPLKSAVLLLTDGAATVGELDHTKLVEFQAANLAAYPDALFCTVGYGDDHQAELCRRLALNGPYSIVRSGEDVGAVIGDLLGGLRTVAATSVRLTIPPHVRQKTGFKMLSVETNQQICVGNLVSGGDQIILLTDVAPEDMIGLHYTLADGTVHDVANLVVSGPTPEVQEAGAKALIRCEVLEIMEHARRHLASGARAADAGVLGQSLMLKARLEAMASDSAVALLLRELHKAHTYLSMPAPPPALSRHLTNQLSQHTEYLGTARGIMSSGYDEEGEDPLSRNTSIFSSTVQRAMSSGMAHAVRSATLPLTPLGSMAPSDPSLPPPPPPSMTPRALNRTPSSPF